MNVPTKDSRMQEGLIYSDNGICLHCGLADEIFYGREICNHIHFPEECSICEMLAKQRRHAWNDAIFMLTEKYEHDTNHKDNPDEYCDRCKKEKT